MNKSLYLFVLLPGLLCSCGGQRWTESVEDGYHLITQKGGSYIRIQSEVGHLYHTARRICIQGLEPQRQAGCV